MSRAPDTWILTADCPSVLGTVDAVTRYLFEQGCYVTEHHSFDDRLSGRFFIRVEFRQPEGFDEQAFRDGLADPRRSLWHDLRADGAELSAKSGDHGLQGRSLPQRPALPPAYRPTVDGRGRGGVQPPRPQAVGRLAPDSLLPFPPRPERQAVPGASGVAGDRRHPAPNW